MELRHRLDPKFIFIGLYVLIVVAYIIIGLKPADAANYTISGYLDIPEINLTTNVAKLSLTSGKLESPDEIAGSYSTSPRKTLIIGHSTTVFDDLHRVKLNSHIFYNNQDYRIVTIETKPKSDIRMSEVLAQAEKETIVLMTCAGQLYGNGDATHRLLITAVRD